MTFVPVIVPPPQPSPRSRELSRRLGELIDQFCREHPGTSAAEVRQALSMASTRTGSSRALRFAVLLGIALLVALVAFFLRG